MTEANEIYCLNCGWPSSRDRYQCRHCWWSLKESEFHQITGIAFLLNEARRFPMRELIPEPWLSRLTTRYRSALRELAGWKTKPAAPATAKREARRERKQRAQRAATPRRPQDWSWLAEQQANLFLFAGAFLVVVAALIYVGYSGQAVGGALKMVLLIAYTLAFLAGGAVCLSVPKVRIAGHVFVAVSAVLVPLNFVLAYNAFEEHQLSAEALWLSGSLTSAALYAGVGALGLGRPYSFASGVALVSAASAFVSLAELPIEWAPVPFLSLAILMALAEISGPEPFRGRVAAIWMGQAHLIAVASLAFALAKALDVESGAEASTRWFLTPAAGLALAFYGLEAAFRQHRPSVAGASLSLTAAGASLVFAPDLSPEYYAFALIGSGFALISVDGWLLPRLPQRFLPEGTAKDVAWFAHAAVAAGVIVAVAAALIATDPDDDYVLQTPWALTGAFAAACLTYALVIAVRDPSLSDARRGGTFGLSLSIAGMLASAVYPADLSVEYYSFAFAAAAFTLLALVALGTLGATDRWPNFFRQDTLTLAHVAAVAATLVAVGAVNAASGEDATYTPDSRWFLPALFGSLLAFYLLALLPRVAPLPDAPAWAAGGLVASAFGVTAGTVYALDVSAEYYAFASLAPALVLGAAGHWGLPVRLDAQLPAGWRDRAMWCGRIASGVGVAVAVVAALAAADAEATYEPDSRVFLPLTFLAAAAFFVMDASWRKSWGASAALLAALTGAGVTVVYAADVGPEYYGVAFVGAGLVYGFAGRVWIPQWLDANARDQAAAVAVTAGWLPFEGVYRDHLQFGAGTHLAASLFYAFAAVLDRSKLTLDRLLDLKARVPVRVGAAWLYASGLALGIGYVYLLRGLPAAEGAEASSLAIPLMALSLGFLAAGGLLRWWRPDMRMHVYVMALLIGITSLSLADGSGTPAVILSAFVAAYLAIGAWEDSPLIALPAAVFGFGAIAAWRQYYDWPLYSVPLAYSSLALVVYAAGFAALRAAPNWSPALRIAGATYAIVAPSAGFALVAVDSDRGLIDGVAFEQSALYECSTLATAVVGLVALVESSIARRGWVVVVGSAVLLVAILLQIGRFHPDNIQAYTAVAGAYLVMLGTLGLARFRLIPDAEDLAPYVEALGAATIMFPSFLQSLEGGWHYQAILFVEAAAFLSLSVALRRRGMLAASLAGLVLVAGRALFDAINALPNWIVALIVGMVLLALGLAILIGRDRWSRWEEAVMTWWEQAGTPRPA